MKNKQSTLFFLAMLFIIFMINVPVNAQEKSFADVLNEYMSDDTTLFEDILGIKKKSDKLNVFLNMQGSAKGYSENGKFENGKFLMDQLRIEARGNINSWLSYRWRQRLNRSNDGQYMTDNLPTSIDFAGIGLNFHPKFRLFIGKQGVAYGGIEYDLNPIYVYEYSEFVTNLLGFATGVNFMFLPTEQHHLYFQILNNRNSSSIVDTYGVSVEDAKLPLIYSLNWNANFNEVFKTRWSFSYSNQAKNKSAYLVLLGQELNWNKFNIYYDIMYAREKLDGKGIIYNIINQGSDLMLPTSAPSEYLSNVFKLNYRVTEKWNVFVKGTFETAGIYKEVSALKADESTKMEFDKGLYSRSWSYTTGIEYYPLKASNLHFFAYYSGRYYNYQAKAKNLGSDNRRTSTVSLGFVYLLPVF